jgi:hypothetical protein
VSFHDTYYQAAAARFPEQVPLLTPAQKAALALFNQTANREDVRLDYWLAPGDMQFVNNHNIVHMRSQFEDWKVGCFGVRWLCSAASEWHSDGVAVWSGTRWQPV